MRTAWHGSRIVGSGSDNRPRCSATTPICTPPILTSSGELLSSNCSAPPGRAPGRRRLHDGSPSPQAGRRSSRQEAVAEVRPRLDLREDLALLGSDSGSAGRRQSLVDWGTAPPVFTRKWPRLLAAFLSLCLFAAALILRSNGDQAALFGFLGAVSGAAAFAWFYRESVRRVLQDAEPARQHLVALSGLLDRMEREHLTSRKLTALRSAFDGDGARPTRAIARLDRLVDLCDLKRKVERPAVLLFLWLWQVILAPFSFLFWYTHIAFSIESWRAAHSRAIRFPRSWRWDRCSTATICAIP